MFILPCISLESILNRLTASFFTTYSFSTKLLKLASSDMRGFEYGGSDRRGKTVVYSRTLCESAICMVSAEWHSSTEHSHLDSVALHRQIDSCHFLGMTQVYVILQLRTTLLIDSLENSFSQFIRTHGRPLSSIAVKQQYCQNIVITWA